MLMQQIPRAVLCPARARPDRTPLWCSNGPRDENDSSGFVAPPKVVRRIRRCAVGRRESRTPKLRTEGQAPAVLKHFTALPPKRGEGEEIDEAALPDNQHSICVCPSFTAHAAPSELWIHRVALPGVSFAVRTSPQAEKFHRIRDSIAEC